MFGQKQYSTLHEKAAVYVRNIIGDHPFSDGNKRTGITAGIIFLQRNGCVFRAQKGEIEDFAVKVATDHLGIAEIAAWLKEHTAK